MIQHCLLDTSFVIDLLNKVADDVPIPGLECPCVGTHPKAFERLGDANVDHRGNWRIPWQNALPNSVTKAVSAIRDANKGCLMMWTKQECNNLGKKK